MRPVQPGEILKEDFLKPAGLSVYALAKTAALPVDEVLPERPLRQWVLSLPHALRFLLATDPDALTLVLSVVYRSISRYLIGMMRFSEVFPDEQIVVQNFLS